MRRKNWSNMMGRRNNKTIGCSLHLSQEVSCGISGSSMLVLQRWNLKNLSCGLNPPKPGLNIETYDTILSGTNHI